jgi:hypothetical protein
MGEDVDQMVEGAMEEEMASSSDEKLGDASF